MVQQKDLIYGLVAHGVLVLADYSSFSGNFISIAEQCLHKLPHTNNTKFSYACDQYTFNFLTEDGIVYLVVSTKEIGRSIPLICLERIKEDFSSRYENTFFDNAVSHFLDKEYGPKLKEHMQYCVDHWEEMNKLANVRAQVSEVKTIMMENIDKVLDRGAKIELLVDKTENLRDQADNFQRQGRTIQRKMWLENMKVKLVVLGIAIIIILIIWLSICKGFKCKH